MDKRVISSSYLLLVVDLLPVCAQQLDSVLIKKGIMQTCQHLVYVSDSVAVQASLDNITALMAGRWSLQIIESGSTAGRKPEKPVELIFNQRRRGIIYEDGQSVASIELVIRRLWGMVRFKIHQQGNSLIKLLVPKARGGLLNVCGEKLFITDERTLYAFRRLP